MPARFTGFIINKFAINKFVVKTLQSRGKFGQGKAILRPQFSLLLSCLPLLACCHGSGFILHVFEKIPGILQIQCFFLVCYTDVIHTGFSKLHQRPLNISDQSRAGKVYRRKSSMASLLFHPKSILCMYATGLTPAMKSDEVVLQWRKSKQKEKKKKKRTSFEKYNVFFLYIVQCLKFQHTLWSNLECGISWAQICKLSVYPGDLSIFQGNCVICVGTTCVYPGREFPVLDSRLK